MRETGCWIRDAELNDAPDLAALMCELGYETKRTEMERRLDLILSNPAQNLCRGHGRLRLRDDWHSHISKL